MTGKFLLGSACLTLMISLVACAPGAAPAPTAAPAPKAAAPAAPAPTTAPAAPAAPAPTAAAAAPAAAPTAPAAAAKPAAAEELKIGGLGSLTGGNVQAVALQRGAEIAIDEIIKAGGLKVGEKVYNPKLIMYDDLLTGQGGTTTATRLVNEDKVKVIIGPVASPAVLGAIGVTNPAKVIAMTEGFAADILKPENKYNFRVALTNLEFAPPIAKWVKDTYPNVKTVGYINPSDAIGQQVVPTSMAAYKAVGIEPVFNEYYERGTQDFTPLLTRMMAKGVDIMDPDGNAPSEVGPQVKQARQLGFKGLIVQGGGPNIEEVINVAGPLSDGFLSYDIFDPQDATAKAFVAAYQAKYQGTINAYAPIFYSATRMVFEAMRRTGTVTDTDKLRDAIEGLTGYDTLFGPVKWTGQQQYKNNHQLLTDFYISEVKGGKWAPVKRIKP